MVQAFSWCPDLLWGLLEVPPQNPGRNTPWEVIWSTIPHRPHFVSCASFQALPYVALLIVMLFFIYAVIGMQVGQPAHCSSASTSLPASQAHVPRHLPLAPDAPSLCFHF